MNKTRFFNNTMVVVAAVGLAFGAAGCSSKPSKDAVTQGMVKLFEAGGSITDSDQMKTMTQCIVDASYDKLSEETLKLIATGDTEQAKTIDDADTTVLSEAGENCAAESLESQ